jgi:hypothetical protein
MRQRKSNSRKRLQRYLIPPENILLEICQCLGENRLMAGGIVKATEVCHIPEDMFDSNELI